MRWNKESMKAKFRRLEHWGPWHRCFAWSTVQIGEERIWLEWIVRRRKPSCLGVVVDYQYATDWEQTRTIPTPSDWYNKERPKRSDYGVPHIPSVPPCPPRKPCKPTMEPQSASLTLEETGELLGAEIIGNEIKKEIHGDLIANLVWRIAEGAPARSTDELWICKKHGRFPIYFDPIPKATIICPACADIELLKKE